MAQVWDIVIKIIKYNNMLDKRFYYDERIAICHSDMEYIRKLKTGKFGKKSLAGILSFIIKQYANAPLPKVPRK